jgi:hypothetical protein
LCLIDGRIDKTPFLSDLQLLEPSCPERLMWHGALLILK